MRAYEIYAMRWAVEVFFSDAKRLLGLADCSARNFSSQIAHISLVMIRYNLMAIIKRTHDYDTIGGLFNDCHQIRPIITAKSQFRSYGEAALRLLVRAI
jgi:hypothetical protein